MTATFILLRLSVILIISQSGGRTEGCRMYESIIHVTLLLNPPPREEDLVASLQKWSSDPPTSRLSVILIISQSGGRVEGGRMYESIIHVTLLLNPPPRAEDLVASLQKWSSDPPTSRLSVILIISQSGGRTEGCRMYESIIHVTLRFNMQR